MKSVNQSIQELQEIIRSIRSRPATEKPTTEELCSIQKRLDEFNKEEMKRLQQTGRLIPFETIGTGESLTNVSVKRCFEMDLRKFLAEKTMIKDQDNDPGFDLHVLKEIKNVLKTHQDPQTPTLLQTYRIEYEPGASCKFVMEYGLGVLGDIYLFMETENKSYLDLEDEIEKAIKDQIRILKKQGMTYKDLHKGNLLLRENYSFVLCDFGGGVSFLEERNDVTDSQAEEVKDDANSEQDKYIQRKIDGFKEEIRKCQAKEEHQIIPREQFFKEFKVYRLLSIYNSIKDPNDKETFDRIMLRLKLPKEVIIRKNNELDKINLQLSSSNLSENNKKQFQLDKHNILFELGNAHFSLGENSKALECYEKAKEGFSYMEQPYKWVHEATVDHSIGNALLSQGKIEEAVKCYFNVTTMKPGQEKFINLLARFGFFAVVASAKNQLGICFNQAGLKDLANKFFAESKDIYEKIYKNKKFNLLEFTQDEKFRDIHEKDELLKTGIDFLSFDLSFAMQSGKMDEVKACKRTLKNAKCLTTQHGINCYLLKAFLYKKEGKTQKFLKNLDKAIEITRKIYEDPHPQLKSYELLKKNYS